MTKHIIKFLNLEGFWLDGLETHQKQLIVKVRSPRVKLKCLGCNKVTAKIHAYKYRQVKHGWYQNQQVVLRIKVRRFKCASCGVTFTEPLPGIKPRNRYSQRFKLSSLIELKLSSFNATANKIGASSSSLIRFLKEQQGIRTILWPLRGDIYLGIDAHSFSGHDLVITITDLKRRRLLAVLKDDRQISLIKWLRAIPAKIKPRIKGVCIDLEASFKLAVKQVLPQAKITADRYHVVQLGSYLVDELRLVIQGLTSPKYYYRRIPKQLLLKPRNRLTTNEKLHLERIWQLYADYPALKQVWLVKNQLQELYQLSSYQQAEIRLKQLIEALTGEQQTQLKYLKGALIRWQTEILNYWLTHITNGYTEGVNNKIKLIKRISFGFKNKSNYIAKLTLAFLPFYVLVNGLHRWW